MPKTDVHIDSSNRKTGKGYHEVHGFVDLESKKPERHDITRMVDHANLIESRLGGEAAQELVQHIHDDMQNKFSDFKAMLRRRAKELADGSNLVAFETLVAEAEKKLADILAYFGVAAGKQVRLYRVAAADVETLRAAGMNAEDLGHSLKVVQKALEIAVRTGAELDLELVGRGALFHDLGKSQDPRHRARPAGG